MKRECRRARVLRIFTGLFVLAGTLSARAGERRDYDPEGVACLFEGDAATNRGAYAVAEASFFAGLDRVRSVHDDEGIAAFVIRMGWLAGLAGETDLSIAYVESAIYDLPRVSAEDRVFALGVLGRRFWEKQRLDLSIARYREALTLARQGGYTPRAREMQSNLDTVIAAEQWELGRQAYNAGSFEAAANHYTAVVAHARANADCLRERDAERELYRALWMLDRRDDALAHLQRALKLDLESGQLWGPAFSLRLLAWSAAESGEAAAAVEEKYETAIRSAVETGARSDEVLARMELGVLLADRGRTAEGFRYLEEALWLARALGDCSAEQQSLAKIGEILESGHRFDAALVAFTEALTVAREEGDLRAITNLARSSGGVAVDLEDDEAAQRFFAESLAAARIAPYPCSEARVLRELADFHLERGEYARAVERFTEAATLADGCDDRHMEGAALYGRATAQLRLGRFSDAVASYEGALRSARSESSRGKEVAVLVGLGAAHMQLGDWPAVADYFERADALFRELPEEEQSRVAPVMSFPRLMISGPKGNDSEKAMQDLIAAAGPAWGAAMQGFVALVNEQPDDAVAELRRADASTSRSRPFSQVAISLMLAGALAESGQNRAAIDALHQVLSTARETGDRVIELAALEGLAALMQEQRNLPLAVLFGKQAVRIAEEMRADVKTLPGQTGRSFTDNVAPMYRSLADALVQLGRIPEAQQVLLLLKDQEFDDFRRGPVEGRQNPDGLAFTPPERRLERQYVEHADRITLLARERAGLRRTKKTDANAAARIRRIDEELRAANRELRDFLAGLESEAVRSSLSKEKVYQIREAEALNSALRELGPGTVAIYTLVLEDRVVEIVITPDISRSAVAEVPRARLNERIAALRLAVEDKSSDPRVPARSLYDVLIAPIESVLEAAQARTILWHLDDALRYVPIAALFDGERYLVDRFRTVVFTPASLPYIRDDARRDWTGIGLGVSKAHEGFSPLPQVPNELAAVIRASKTAATGVIPGTILLDDTFTEDALLVPAVPAVSVVHIATHFVLGADQDSSYLLLGDGGRLTLRHLETAVDPFEGVELVALSACNTGSGGVRADGRDVDGLAFTVQRQGAKAVLATLWSVADRSTVTLMESFYRLRQLDALPKAEALREAQRMLLHGSGEHAHPYYWAPFILIGNPR